MCGICGFFTLKKLSDSEVHLKNMSSSILHRGPDDFGFWKDEEAGIFLAHQRLAIVDLSPAGQQPMISDSGRYILIFNGEIYNHNEIRKELESGFSHHRWRGHSDTETLLVAIESLGLEKALKKLTGMFSLVLWDREARSLTLTRDRMGEKPLYFGWQGQADNATLLFGSELKALKAHPVFEGQISRGSLALQLRHNYIPAPYSIYEGIHKLLPGHLLVFQERDLKRRLMPSSRPYWSLVDIARTGIENEADITPSEAIQQLDSLLSSSIKQQMMSDVPLGAFLSGGIDSSTIVSIMQANSSRAVKTFSIGFDDKGYNEAVHAKAVARHIGTDHTELYVKPQEAIEVIPMLPKLYDEPFSDSSQIPTFLVSQLAKKSVTVALSGDGGDELFCGYNRYQLAQSIWKKLRFMPPAFKKSLSKILTAVPIENWNTYCKFIPGASRYANFGDKVHKGANLLAAATSGELYMGLVSHWDDPSQVVLNGREPSTLLAEQLGELSNIDDVHRMMLLDGLTYLPDDILTKVDRASMGVSLECRVPFLDHRVVEFAWSLPLSLKLREGKTKWVLRQVLQKYVPQKLIERPKMGFGVPLDSWLRGPLRDWAEDLLDESRLKREGFFNPNLIQKKWREHLSGKRNWQYHLWDILVFQSWLEGETVEKNKAIPILTAVH